MTEAIVGSGADAIGVLFGDVWNGGDLDALDRVFTSDVRPMSYGGMTWCRLSDGLISEAWVAANVDEMVASLISEA
jgi:hypothetical protein